MRLSFVTICLAATACTSPEDGVCTLGEPWIGLDLRDLGNFEGYEDDLANGNAINDAGTVVGIADRGAFIWTEADGMQPIPEGDDVSPLLARGINNVGQVVGQAYVPAADGSYWVPQAFVWDEQGGTRQLGVLDNSAGAWGINDNGLAAGRSGEGATLWDSFTGDVVWSRPQNTTGEFHDLNADGIAVGHEDGRAVIYTGGSVPTPLPGLSDGISQARGISDSGYVVVEANDEWGRNQCYRYAPDDGWSEPLNLGLLDEPWIINHCLVEDVNNAGEVVGSDYGGGGTTRAWAWREGEKVDLNALLTEEQRQEWELIAALDLNDDGLIVGIAEHQALPGRAFLATPVCK